MSHEEIKKIIQKQKNLKKKEVVSVSSNEYKLIKSSECDEMDLINKNNIIDHINSNNSNHPNSSHAKEIEDLNKEICDLGITENIDEVVDNSNENIEDLKLQILNN